jgi:catalase
MIICRGQAMRLLSPPVLYNPQIEHPRQDESQIIDDLQRSFDLILATTHRDYGRAVRAVHAKAHGIIKGRFRVLENLPSELAQGLFAAPGEYDAIARISTNPGDILDDAVALPRGFALKIIGVPGERLPDADGVSQDFVMVNGPVFVAPNARKFAGNLKLLARTTDRGESAKVFLSKILQSINSALGAVGYRSTLLGALGGAPQVHPLGETYYSVTPFRYGTHIAKFRLRPVSPSLTTLTGRTLDTSGQPNAIREAVKRAAATSIGEWAFEVQLCRNVEKQPIEDASVEWMEDDAPFARVATLQTARQDSWNEAVVIEVDDGMRFSAWTGLLAHQPLGNVNRARKETYKHSAEYRAAANRCPIREP